MWFFLITFPTAWFKLVQCFQTEQLLVPSVDYNCLATFPCWSQKQLPTDENTEASCQLHYREVCYSVVSNRQILFSFSSAFIPAAIIDSTLPWKKIIKKKKNWEFSFRGLDMMLTSTSLELEQHWKENRTEIKREKTKQKLSPSNEVMKPTQEDTWRQTGNSIHHIFYL